MSRNALPILFASNLALAACGGAPATGPVTPSAATAAAATSTAAPSTTAPAAIAATTAPPPAVALASPEAGKTTFYVYESYLSPPQQPGDETDAPKPIAHATGLVSTAPSVPREQRKSLGHGRIRFAKNLARAYVDVEIEGVNPADILMFHVHCGPPGVLGPIIVDFSEFGDLTKTLAGGKLSVELTNKNITFVKDMPHGLKPALPESCPVEVGFPTQSMTVAAMEYLARKGVLYFNLHTRANTFYGEVRGQIYSAKE